MRGKAGRLRRPLRCVQPTLRPPPCPHSWAGYIHLELPIFHVGYFKNTIAILQCVCKTCARVMMPEDERRQHLRRLRSPKTDVRTALVGFVACGRVTRAILCAGEQPPRSLQEADGALQALQALPVLQRCARHAPAVGAVCRRVSLRRPGIVKRAGSSMKIVHDKYGKHADLLV